MPLAPEALDRKLETLPARPGVYLFVGADQMLYVGKARNLRSRVRSYFQPGSSDVRAFVARLRSELVDLQTFVATSEREAALLENQLIKEHQPRYNVKLRDDKEFLSLRLDRRQRWPRLRVVRKPKKDHASYFGPYHSASAARQTLRLVNRYFQLRTCTDSEFKARRRPCLQHQIKRCPAPCVLEVEREHYDTQVEGVALFLEGRHDELIKRLEGKMREASTALRYEDAAVYRDQLQAVSRVQQSQRVSAVRDVDQDIVGAHRQADQAELALLSVRAGKLVRVHTFAINDIALPDDELIASFVAELYGSGHREIPDEVILPVEIEAMGGLGDLLTELRANARRKKVKVLAPKRAARAALVEMARENAEHSFHQKRRAEEDVEARLAQVQRKLRLSAPPHRIECVDVSHTGGEETVAAIVALLDGAPDRARYRSFHVKRVSGGDDYGAMYEVLLRRFKRGRENESGWELPDLLVVDGGKGQLGVALAALRDLQMELPVAALAKEKQDARSGDRRVDRVYLPGQKNAIPVHSTPALRMLSLARDEAHRVSNRLRNKLRKKRRFTSGLDGVPGIGPKTRTKLLKGLGSFDAVTAASEEELIAAGATRRQARAILDEFGGSGTTTGAEEDALENAFEVMSKETSETSETSEPAPASTLEPTPEPTTEPTLEPTPAPAQAPEPTPPPLEPPPDADAK